MCARLATRYLLADIAGDELGTATTNIDDDVAAANIDDDVAATTIDDDVAATIGCTATNDEVAAATVCIDTAAIRFTE